MKHARWFVFTLLLAAPAFAGSTIVILDGTQPTVIQQLMRLLGF